MFNGIRRLTPEIIKNSKYDFNIVWGSNQFIFIKLSEKKTNKFELMHDDNKDVNPMIISPLLMKKQGQKVLPTDGLSLLDRYL